MNHTELSEVNFGLILSERCLPSLYKPEWFSAPYDKGVEILMKPGSSKEDVARVLSSAYINDAHDSVRNWNGVGEEVEF